MASKRGADSQRLVTLVEANLREIHIGSVREAHISEKSPLSRAGLMVKYCFICK